MENRIGQALRRAREARSLTWEQVSEALHIKPRYLQALEEGRWEDLPSPAQGRGFLRLYAAFLGVDLSEFGLPDKQAPKAPKAPAQEAEAAVTAWQPTETTPAEVPKPQLVSTAAPDADPAQAIFAELGETLRQQRERLGISLAEAERRTHVRRHLLEAMEEGRFDDLPSPVQARGMLQHYARFLQLDVDRLLLRFADAIQARYRARQPKRALRPSNPLGPRLRLPERTLGLTLAALAVLFVLWGAWQVLRVRANAAPAPTPPSVLEVLFPTASSTPTLPPFTATPTPGLLAGPGQVTGTPEPQQAANASNAPVQVYVVVRQRAYLRAVVDGEVRLAERVLPGSTYFFGGDARVELTTGNGAAIQVYFNQQDLGLMGRFGQAVTRVYTLNGVQTPTPSPSPTPTATPPETATPSPTVTPTPTPTTLP